MHLEASKTNTWLNSHITEPIAAGYYTYRKKKTNVKRYNKEHNNEKNMVYFAQYIIIFFYWERQ
jgi:hypothetical protein